MSKFERVLSDEEMAVAINDGCTADLFSLAERVEQTVLARLAGREPVAWAANAALQNNFYLIYGCPAEVFASEEALLNEYDKAEVVPLYTAPQLAEPVVKETLTVPDGWQLVPKEPTERMLNQGESEWTPRYEANRVYHAMLAAAPTYTGETE